MLSKTLSIPLLNSEYYVGRIAANKLVSSESKDLSVMSNSSRCTRFDDGDGIPFAERRGYVANQYGIWLSWNNQQEGFELPILPREIGPSIQGDGAGHDVFGIGKINVIKDRGLAEYTIESIFPAQRYPFVTAQYLLEPRAYVDYIMRWWETKRPIRLTAVLPSIEINTPVSIEQFEWKEVAGSPGDISFSLRLKEYRFYAARRVQVLQQAGVATIQKSQPKRPDERVQPKTYTLKPGDTLWAVAQRYLGNGNRWREIAKLNGIKDSQVRSLPVGLTLKLPS